MRVITEEYKKMLEESEIYNFILNTPKPDFTKLHEENIEFEEEIKKEHDLLREKLKELRDAN